MVSELDDIEESAMAMFNGTQYNDTIDIRNQPLGQYETSHGVVAGSGDDIVYGSSYVDVIQGQDGNDTLYGFNGNDSLIGGSDDDALYGGAGSDFLSGGQGNDTLVGGVGNDTMYGEGGDDLYVHGANEGVDTINDDLTAAATPGYGGGSDTIYFPSLSLDEIAYSRPDGSDDLWLSSFNDFSDGTMNDGVIVEDFFLGGNNTVEILATGDGYYVDLTGLLV